MDEIENEIGTALMRLRIAFAKHDIPCPDILAFSDRDKAYEAVRRLRRVLGPTTWAMNRDAMPFGEASIAGFSLTFEAREIERPGTGIELDDGVSGRAFWDGPKLYGPEGD